MFLKNKNRKETRSLSARLTRRYLFLLFTTNLFFIVAMFIFIKGELKQKDDGLLRAHYDEISVLLRENNIDFIKNRLRFESLLGTDETLLLQIYGKNGEFIFNKPPGKLKNFDPAVVEQKLQEARTHFGFSTIHPILFIEETFRIYSGQVGDYTVVAGINTDDSEDFLEDYLRYSLYLLLGSGLISYFLGYYSSKKAVSPIRDLIHSVREVQNGRLKIIESPSLAQDELSELTHLFNKMVIQINQQISSIQESLDAIAHDLRTPLTHLVNRFETMLKKDSKEFSRDVVYEFLEETQSMVSLLNTLLELSEAESKKIQHQPFDIKKLLTECVEIYEYVTEEKKATFELHLIEQLVTGDRNKLKRAFANLIDNALKYSDATPKIQITAMPVGQEFHITIQDHGRGMPATDLEKIWQRLYRGDTSRSTTGMGLGLSFVKSIIEAHGWKISVDTSLGHGSRFTIIIP